MYRSGQTAAEHDRETEHFLRIYRCQNCGHSLFFENVRCESCGYALGFLPDTIDMSALEAAGGDAWRALGATPGQDRYRMCANYVNENICNWMVPEADPHAYCRACRLNSIVPDLSVPGNREHWARLEVGKRRTVYGLMRLGLPIVDRVADPEHGLTFKFMADVEPSFRESGKVMTGHANGVITINLKEADSAVREKLRLDLDEVYRTILGHFRHEIGHYYWEQLIDGTAHHEPFRALFGDERADYDEALSRHYKQGPPPDWTQRFVTPYASMHPWEDWAETWAHYLHICDTLETASAFDVRIRAPNLQNAEADIAIDCNVYHPQSFDDLTARWYPLTFAVNSINRSMGQPDLYPFVLSPLALDKLRFVHEAISVSRSD